jgi:all-trans-retinol 13,14-reductase
MKEYFPAETGAIDRYLDLVQRAAKASRLFFAEKAVPPSIAFIAGRAMRSGFLKLARRTTKEVLDGLTDNAELKAVLTGQFGDYGLEPGRSSFAMHAILVRHYLRGAYYPVGGASAIAGAIAPVIEATGGQILYQAEVDEVLTHEWRAVGVRLVDGAEFEAPLVISDAGLHNTYRHLLSPEVRMELRLAMRAERQQPSVGHLCLYVGFKQSAAKLNLPKHNFWIYPGPDHDANIAAYLENPEDPQTPLPLVYVSFPSAKDPTFEERYPGRATIELLTLAPFESFAPWVDTDWRKRGDDYVALKASFANRMLDQLDPHLPGLRDQIDYMEVSTPLSTRHFAGYQQGEIYGLSHSPERFLDRSLRPRTPIRGLYLTGQDIVTCGVAGAMAAGYVTTSAILGKNLLK